MKKQKKQNKKKAIKVKAKLFSVQASKSAKTKLTQIKNQEIKDKRWKEQQYNYSELLSRFFSKRNPYSILFIMNNITIRHAKIVSDL